MKKIGVVLCIVTICAGIMLFSGEQEKKQTPVVKEVEGFWYGHMVFTGPYSTMQKKVQEFMNEFFKQGLMPTGMAISLYYNSPQNAKEDELKWAFGFVIPAETPVKEPLKKMEFKKHKAVVYLHEGPYGNLGKSHELVQAFIYEKGYKIAWPLYDKYLNNPQTTKPEDLKTEIVVPIETK